MRSNLRWERRSLRTQRLNAGSRGDTPRPMDLPLRRLTSRTTSRTGRTVSPHIAIAAGAAILRFDCRNVSTRHKADESPVTLADEAAAGGDLATALREGFPGVPVVSEEGGPAANCPAPTFFLVDPLDGTREFLAGRDEYTVNIALVRDGVPVVGVVAAPALGLVWRGGGGPRRTAAACRPDGTPSRAGRRSEPAPWPARALSRRSAARTTRRQRRVPAALRADRRSSPAARR